MIYNMISYAKDIADLILTYDGDDYIHLGPLDIFGDEMFSFDGM